MSVATFTDAVEGEWFVVQERVGVWECGEWGVWGVWGVWECCGTLSWWAMSTLLAINSQFSILN